MPNRPLAVRYEDDFSLFAGRWERIGLALLAIVVLAYPWVASSNWITVAWDPLESTCRHASLSIL